MKQLISKNNAFSLLELLAVVTIIGIIAAIILPRVSSTAAVAKEKTCYHNRGTIGAAAERYYSDNGAWPANDLSDIAADTDYFPSGIPTCPVSGSAYALNATTHRVEGHTNSSNH